MMKRILFVFMFLNSIASHSLAQIIRNHEPRLRAAYIKLIQDHSVENQKAYFDAFPNNWAELLIMDWESTKREIDTQIYVNAFADLPAINDTLYYRTLMNIVFGASLVSHADATSRMQDLLHAMMGDTTFTTFYDYATRKVIKIRPLPELMLGLLAKEQKGDIMRFWQFYWSNIRYEENNGSGNDYSFSEEFFRLQKIVAKKYPDMMEAMSIAYLYFNRRIYGLSSYGRGIYRRALYDGKTTCSVTKKRLLFVSKVWQATYYKL